MPEQQHTTDVPLTPQMAADAVMQALTRPDAGAVLAALHTFELTVRDNMEWPWMRWKHLAVDDAAYLSALPATLPGHIKPGPEADILAAGLTARRGVESEADATTIKQLFASGGVADASAPLHPSAQLELMMLAVHERTWPVVETIADRLLAMDGITDDTTLNASIDDLLLEALFFSIYRPYMPHYVPNPAPLIDKLTALADRPAVARLLAAETRAGITYRANMLAMRGDFDAALPLYARVATMPGFRSPVFQQTQVLLDVADLTADTRETDLNWYRNRSNISHHFPTPPEGEHAILVAVEASYLKHYGQVYAEIVGTINPGALIHFHLVNFPADRQGTIDQLNQIAAAANVRINYSFEDNQIMRDKPQLRGGVCVNTRYIYLPDYLAHYTGVTITDVDGWLTKTLAELTDFGDRDSLVSSWVWKKNTGYWRLPWGNLSGGYCSIRASDTSKAFAELIAQYLTRLFARNAFSGKPLFYADQAAHFLCLKKAERDFGMNIGFIGGGFAQSEELPFHDRHAGKLKAMQEKLAELRANASN